MPVPLGVGFALLFITGMAEAGIPAPPPKETPPDPASVQRYGPAYRYPQPLVRLRYEGNDPAVRWGYRYAGP